jgi:hypothetical protein
LPPSGDQSVAQAISFHVASFQAACQLIGLEPVPSGHTVVGALVGRVSSAGGCAPAQTRRPLSLRRSWTRSPVRHGLSRRAGLVIETATFPKGNTQTYTHVRMRQKVRQKIAQSRSPASERRTTDLSIRDEVPVNATICRVR